MIFDVPGEMLPRSDVLFGGRRCHYDIGDGRVATVSSFGIYTVGSSDDILYNIAYLADTQFCQIQATTRIEFLDPDDIFIDAAHLMLRSAEPGAQTGQTRCVRMVPDTYRRTLLLNLS